MATVFWKGVGAFHPSQGLLWIFPYMGPDAETVSKRSGPCVTPECEGVEWVMTTVPVGYQAWIGGVGGYLGGWEPPRPGLGYT